MFSKKNSAYLLAFCFFSTFLIPSHAEEIGSLDLTHAQGCKGCHIINKIGGTFGPALDGVGQRLTHKQIRQKLIDPKKGNISSLMPDSRHLTKLELDLLTDFLTALR